MSNPTNAETGEMRPHIPSPTLDAIRQREQAATPGPWRVVEEHGRDISDEGWSRIAIQSEVGNRAEVAEIIGDDVSYGAEEWNANAEFLAHAREDIPALVAEVERLAAGNTAWKQWSELWRSAATPAALAEARQELAHRGTGYVPAWDDLNDHERKMSTLEAANWLKALRSVRVAPPVPEAGAR